MSLPNPSMDFVPFDILTADELDNLVENDQALAAGTGLNTSAIATAKIADDAVTAAKIDWATTGANGGIWWEEIGRTTLGSAGDTLTVSSLPARKRLKVYVTCLNSGQIGLSLTLNGDSGTNYARRVSVNGGADTSSTSSSAALATSQGSVPISLEFEAVNISTVEKHLVVHMFSPSSAGATNAPTREEWVSKWANTSSQISSITVSNTGTGDFAIGSEIVVLGHN